MNRPKVLLSQFTLFSEIRESYSGTYRVIRGIQAIFYLQKRERCDAFM